MAGDALTRPDYSGEPRLSSGASAEPDTLHGLFESQSCRTPRALALVCGREGMTYGELNARAGALARDLANLGVQRGALVGIAVERSLDLAIGLLGILKCGAAYVPLDPMYPSSRLAYMLRDAELGVVLTQRRLAARLPRSHARLLCLDQFNRGEAPFDSTARPRHGTADASRGRDLAYVMYTSGSTGQPKGVMIEHAAVANTIADVNRRFYVGPRDRVLALSSCSFDLSVYDMFGLWASGGCVILPTEREARNPASWSALCARHRVTLWNSVPACMDMMVGHQEVHRDAALDHLRLVLLSGDWIPLTLPDRIRALKPDAQVVSLGGATEVSIWSIIYPIDRVEPGWSSIPYGRAMDRQTVHVLDDRFCPVAPGEVGQICYGGAGLARGYWRRPELTRERFIDAANVAPRLYCSGDLGRMRPDGVVELLGRMDRQVKIRGYRVELGEIESALLRHPAVRHNAVIADRAGAGTDQLIAFIVGTNGEAPTPNELRRFLAAQLPDYMVPARFFHLDSLPLTDNQKVDRAALSAVAAQRRALATPSGEQASAFERRLLRLWETVLAQSGLGIDDKFFEIGGDSLSAAKLVARIEREFGRQISLDTLLEQPTVRQLAQLLETSPSANAGGATSPRQGCLADKRLVRANHNQAVTAPAASRDGKRHPPIATRGATSYTRRVTEIGSNWKRTLRRFLRTILGDFNG